MIRLCDMFPIILGNSSTGRASDSDSVGCRFESCFPSQKIWSSAPEWLRQGLQNLRMSVRARPRPPLMHPYPPRLRTGSKVTGMEDVGSNPTGCASFRVVTAKTFNWFDSNTPHHLWGVRATVSPL